MGWTDFTRRQYARRASRYASDLTDREWGLISPCLPGPRRLGRPRSTDLREVVNALLYIASTGCQWRMLPKDFPPFTTVQAYFYEWRATGLWGRINHRLVMETRELEGLRQKVEWACDAAGLGRETRRFTPHVTLARLNRSSGAIGGWLSSFGDLHALVAAVANETPGLGAVWAYDVATRIGAKQGLFPERIYLHAGTKAGAKAMGLDHRAAAIEVPRELRRLTAAQAEDFLCICKDELARVSRGFRSRSKPGR